MTHTTSTRTEIIETPVCTACNDDKVTRDVHETEMAYGTPICADCMDEISDAWLTGAQVVTVISDDASLTLDTAETYPYSV